MPHQAQITNLLHHLHTSLHHHQHTKSHLPQLLIPVLNSSQITLPAYLQQVTIHSLWIMFLQRFLIQRFILQRLLLQRFLLQRFLFQRLLLQRFLLQRLQFQRLLLIPLLNSLKITSLAYLQQVIKHSL